MRTIFITPILWKRLNRAALRRGEDGQAIILIALVLLGLVTMVSLAIDGGIGYLESTELQRAADNAALAGVTWVPDHANVADARAQLSAEANGVKVACYYNTALPATSDYNKRCKRVATEAQVFAGEPEQFYSFDSSQPNGLGFRYRVTLAKMQERFFLKVIGFPKYLIKRTATAQYSRLVKFGSAFNYFGTFGVLHDHWMRCDKSTLADCGTLQGGGLDMYGAIYQRYVLMRCEQPNAPPKCVGGFWGHIAGPNLVNASGDAYTPFRNGANSGGPPIGSNGGVGASCIHVSDPNSWIISKVFDQGSGNTSPNCDLNARNGTAPIRTQDFHPDSPVQANGFGYELGIEVDSRAIYSYSDTQANLANHTNLNVTIYDGALAEIASGETWGTSDNYQINGGGRYSVESYANFNLQHRLITETSGSNRTDWWNRRTVLCSPGTTGCGTVAVPAAAGVPAQTLRANTAASYESFSKLFPDLNTLELSYNDMRTRLTLYGPPTVPSIPSTYQNVSGNKIGSFEMTDMSVRERSPNGEVYLPIGDEVEDYCYIIFDDIKAMWDNTREPAAAGGPNQRAPYDPAGGTGPDYAYVNNYSSGVGLQAQSNRYSYVCPNKIGVNTGTDSRMDYRWNQLRGTPAARYGNFFISPISAERTIQKEILESLGSNQISVSPIVTRQLQSPEIASNDDLINPARAGVSSIWSPTVSTTSGSFPNLVTTTKFTHVVDPAQSCRRSAVDRIDAAIDPVRNDWPIDPLWGHNRIPFNMAYADPLVNRAWITSTIPSVIGANPLPITTRLLQGYYTLYYSFHGWSCDWDFDGNYTMNRLKFPDQPPGESNPSLSQAARSFGGNYDRAFVLGHPGLSSNDYISNVLRYASGASQSSIAKELLPTPSNSGTGNVFDSDREFGLQPYFHLTNIRWDQPSGGNLAAAVDATGAPYGDSTSPVRAGTYMLQIQVLGGQGANRYSVKAEYENAKVISTTVNGIVMRYKPVPNVYAVSAMALYANSANVGGQLTQDILFDMAYIPTANAGSLAILELFDAGDITGASLGIQILAPSGWGPKVNTNGSANNPANWIIEVGAAIDTRLTACPYTLKADSLGLLGGCYPVGMGGLTDIKYAHNGSPIYNDQWMLMTFTIPAAGLYEGYKAQCASRGVPEELCYYYQINYKLGGAGAIANDTTTWQLIVQNQPIHLVLED